MLILLLSTTSRVLATVGGVGQRGIQMPARNVEVGGFNGRKKILVAARRVCPADGTQLAPVSVVKRAERGNVTRGNGRVDV